MHAFTLHLLLWSVEPTPRGWPQRSTIKDQYLSWDQHKNIMCSRSLTYHELITNHFSSLIHHWSSLWTFKIKKNSKRGGEYGILLRVACKPKKQWSVNQKRSGAFVNPMRVLNSQLGVMKAPGPQGPSNSMNFQIRRPLQGHLACENFKKYFFPKLRRNSF